MENEPSKFDRLPKTLASVREFNAGKGIVIFFMGALLYVGHAAFIPVALALLFDLILSSPVEALHRYRVPRSLSAAVILLLTLSAIGGMVAVLWQPAQDWYASAPHTLAVIQKKITPVARLVNHLEDLTNRAGAVGSAGRPASAPAATLVLPHPNLPAEILAGLGDSVVGLATFMIITLFLLTGGTPMVARMAAAFFDHLKANHVQRLIEKVRAEVAHFYVTTALINVGLGIATGLVMQMWGMPTPWVWGALAALLNFIPYAGSATTLIVVSLVALVTFDGLGQVLGVAVSYVGLAAIEGQIVQPLLVGHRLEVNPLLIFLGLWFGGFFWGIAGVILATPTLVALKVIAEHSMDGQSMMQFLGPNGEPSPRQDTLRKMAGRAVSE